jgi:phospholipase/carboxylesterase
VKIDRKAQEGVLQARPGALTGSIAAGKHRLDLGAGRDGILAVPPQAQEKAHPLIVLLHGSGADSHDIYALMDATAEQHGCVLLIPDSRQYTWDVIVGGLGPDVRFIDRALHYTFARCRIDTQHIALAGFSDGASYALTLGVTNGDLFTHIMAFSPGFMVPPRLEDTPRIFLSHGVRDEVLPIDRCSRRIAPELRDWDYDLTYREFPDGHTVPGPIVTEAMRWFLHGVIQSPDKG